MNFDVDGLQQQNVISAFDKSNASIGTDSGLATFFLTSSCSVMVSLCLLYSTNSQSVYVPCLLDKKLLLILKLLLQIF